MNFIRNVPSLLAFLACGTLVARAAGGPGPTAQDLAVPRYAHVFVIIDENKDYAQIEDPKSAPTFAELAKRYGNATNFFAETHPSEPNYVALVGGDTFGIADDDAYYCAAGSNRPMCEDAKKPGYPNHTVPGDTIGSQLSKAGLSWKGYYESIPAPGSGVTTASDPRLDNGTKKTALYASKHSGFMNYATMQSDPQRAQRIVGFDQLERDLASGNLPALAVIVPNQCDDMHGLHGPKVPADCATTAGLIHRGDTTLRTLVNKIQASNAWTASSNAAIVITFDEADSDAPSGCCGWGPGSEGNTGGGHIPTAVITNHGPRGVTDATPYNHYSLLRTIEDAFGIHTYLRHAGDSDKGIKPMLLLFATTGSH
jgi:phosphatidylinositol-3-phosphatase